MEYGVTLQRARAASMRTQAVVAERSGVARPNIAAFEAGRREPRWGTAVRVLEAAGARVVIEDPVAWSWTSGRRPYAVPSRLWRLSVRQAVRVLTPGLELWWSGPARSFDLADRADRLRAYEVVLREGTPEAIEAVVDGALLIDGWADLVLPAELRRAWQPLIDAAMGSVDQAS
ncbi:MAG: helix-turn-helix domain-containing protein [Acidimicrobiia bacterium]